MKKVDFKFLLIQGVALLAISAVVGIIISVVMGDEEPIVVGFRFMSFFFFLIALMYVGFGNEFTGTIAKKTMAKNAQKEGFRECSTFITDGSLPLVQL